MEKRFKIKRKLFTFDFIMGSIMFLASFAMIWNLDPSGVRTSIRIMFTVLIAAVGIFALIRCVLFYRHSFITLEENELEARDGDKKISTEYSDILKVIHDEKSGKIHIATEMTLILTETLTPEDPEAFKKELERMIESKREN